MKYHAAVDNLRSLDDLWPINPSLISHSRVEILSCFHNLSAITEGCRFNSKDILLAIELFYRKGTRASLPGGDFY